MPHIMFDSSDDEDSVGETENIIKVGMGKGTNLETRLDANTEVSGSVQSEKRFVDPTSSFNDKGAFDLKCSLSNFDLAYHQQEHRIYHILLPRSPWAPM